MYSQNVITFITLCCIILTLGSPMRNKNEAGSSSNEPASINEYSDFKNLYNLAIANTSDVAIHKQLLIGVLVLLNNTTMKKIVQDCKDEQNNYDVPKFIELIQQNIPKDTVKDFKYKKTEFINCLYLFYSEGRDFVVASKFQQICRSYKVELNKNELKFLDYFTENCNDKLNFESFSEIIEPHYEVFIRNFVWDL
ncbi:uncharacterized protein LOC126898845 [Daktulosphaira vitifoliae]|uniref:uncharacterized protein LOC126898845 n=1 Tax=Daktulosphaira vitifoliae TaxID=58002 RepID=UPI0021AA35B2|nr:uncharacterized protein LOC126898845 [Daktulosphaira vitifoliae]